MNVITMGNSPNTSHEIISQKATQERIGLNTDLISGVLAAVMVFTMFGNILVLFSFHAQPTLRKVKYFPIINLALADMLCALTAMPLYIIKKNAAASEYIDDRLVCDLYRFFYFFTEYASIMSLMVISIERFLNVKYPLQSRNYIRARHMIYVLVACWVEALIVATMPFYWRNEKATECTNSPTATWSLMAISVNVFAPFLIMFSSHGFIYYKTLSEFGQSYSAQNKPLEASHLRNKTVVRAEKWKIERKATISFTVVIGIFIMCWGPSTTYYFTANVSPELFDGSFKRYEDIVGTTMKILTFCNSFINPVIYFWLNLEFRQAFIRVLKREWQARSRSGTTNSMTMNSL